MRGIVMHGAEDFRVEDVPDPGVVEPTDALVRVELTAICGSDLHLWHHGPVVGEGGHTVGHEFLGVVEEVGAGVQHVRRGDRVLSACTVGCGRCDLCLRGCYSGCRETTRVGGLLSNVYGNPLLPGAQAEAVRVPFADANLLRLPGSLSDEEVLFLTDILPTGFMGAELADIEVGDTVVVMGCGPVGSLAQSCAALFGPATIVAVDLDDGRLERARKQGCVPVNPGRQDLREAVLELSEGRGADAVIEAVGRPELVRDAVELARPGGRIAAIGVILEETLPVPFLRGLFAKNLTLRSGLVNPQVHFQRLLPLVEQGRLRPSDLITHRLPLSDGIRGYRVFASHDEGALKVVLRP
jgi:threonine dehydrogenase-like Zn-dependent dehydrogenase